ncbi:MAG: ABC transporter permease subunit [Verrucomicrobia bacterium]|nr:ABC transporter permease subunit [Verrucomicrobiota bacterium]
MEPKKVKWSQVGHHWEIYLFVIPTLIAIGLFIYYPAASGIFHSFFRWNGADISEPLGVANYKDLLFSTEFWRSFKNAFIIGIWNVVKMIPPLFVAVAIHRCKSDRMQFLYRILFVVPMVIPPLIIALVWRSFFFEATNGYLNQFIYTLHLRAFLDFIAPLFGWGEVFTEASSPAWLGDPRLILTAVIIWGFPWVSSLAVLTHLAKLQGIGKEIYEAGDIDGVNWWSKFTKIEFPLITGSIYIMLVFTIIGTIVDAGMILALAGFEGGPGGRVDVPALFMLRKAFVDQKMGYACAVGIILMLIVMSLQKIASLVNDWRGYDIDRKKSIRRKLFTTAVILNVLAPVMLLWEDATLPLWKEVIQAPGTVFHMWISGWVNGYEIPLPGIFHVVSIVLMIGVLPYPKWFGYLVGFVRKIRTGSTEAIAGNKGDMRNQRVIAREESAVFRATRSVGQFTMRGFKHGYIWFVLAFAFLPLYLMVIVSFKTNTQFYAAPATLTHPVHPENWAAAWEKITPTLANSVFLSVSSTLLMISIALMAAYFFARLRMPLSTFFWNAILILMMLPMIANLVPLFRLLRDMNLLNTLTALILVGAAQGQIFAIFMLRNFVSDIPQDLYEAAEIDGASHFMQMRQIVLPLSGPILGTVGVMHFMTAWNDFVLPLIVMRDHARLPVMVQLIRMAGDYIKLWGPLMAGYAMASIPIIILFVFSMKLFVRGMTEGAVKG